MSSNTNIGNTPVNQGYVQLIHMGETGGIDGTLRALYDGDGTASDLLIASDKVKISTTLYIGSDTLAEYIQDTVGAMFSSNTETNITVTYQDADGTIDLVSSGEVTLVGSQTLTNKTLTSPVINTGISGTAILDEDNMASNSATKLSSQQAIKAYVDTEVAGIVDTAPAALNTLNELAAALGDDANYATTTATALGTKLVKASNLSDLTNATTARSNLGLGTSAVLNTAAVANSATTLSTGDQIYDFVIGLGYTTNTGDITSVVAGTGLSGGATSDVATLNVDASQTQITAVGTIGTGTWQGTAIASAYLDADTAHLSGTQTFSGAKTFSSVSSITLGGHSFNDIDIGSEFVDADDHIMSAGAIKEKIENYGYTTSVGDITGVDLTGGTGIAIGSETNTTSGAYSSTISLSHLGLEDLADPNDDRILFWDDSVGDVEWLDIGSNISISGSSISATNTTYASDDFDHDALINFVVAEHVDWAGSGTGTIHASNYTDTVTTIDGTTANGVLTYGGVNNIDTESTLTFDSSNDTLNLNGQYNDVTLNGTSNGTNGCWDFVNSGTWGQTRMYVQDANNVAGRLTFDFRGNAGSNKILAGDSTGLVGIGTTSPATTLHLANSSTAPILRLSNDADTITAGADLGVIQFYSGDNSGGGDAIKATISAIQPATSPVSGELVFKTTLSTGSLTEAMRIDSSQNVGIGETGPTHKLQVASAGSSDSVIRINADNARGASRYALDIVDDDTNSRGSVRISTTSGPSLIATGNVGIGNTAPNMKLQITHSDQDGLRLSAPDGAESFIDFGDVSDNDIGRISYDHADNSMTLRANNNSRVQISSAGTKFSENFSSTDDILHINPANGHNRIMELAGDAINVFTGGGTSSNTLKLQEDGGNVSIGGGGYLTMGGISSVEGGEIQLEPATDGAYTNTWKIDNYYDHLRIFNTTTAGEQVRITEVGDICILPTTKMKFDGDGSTYISESANDLLDITVGGALLLRLEESGTDSVFTNDNVQLGVGIHKDLTITHNGTHNYIDLNNGNLYFRDDADNNIFTVYREGGGIQLSEGDLKIPATSKLYLDGGSDTYIYEASADVLDIVVGGVLMMKLTEAGDGVEIPQDSHPLKIGAGSDLQLSHNGTHSYIENYTGDLIIDNKTSDSDINIKVNDGGVTKNAIQIDASENGSVYMWNDNAVFSLGAGNDLRFWHDGTNSNMYNYVGNLNIGNATDDGDIILYSDDGSGGMTAYLTLDGSAERIQFDKKAYIPDNVKFEFGTGADLQIYHDGTNSYLKVDYSSGGTTRTSEINMYDSADGSMKFKTDNASSGGIEFWTEGTKRLEVQRGGNLAFSGAVTGITGFYGASNTFTGYNNTYNFKNASSGDMMTLNSTGLGIGTTSPNQLLHIGSRGTASDPSISTSLDGIMFDFYNAGNPYQRKASIISNSADNSEAIMAFWTTAASSSASQKMTINGAGNVGIGTTAPQGVLSVVLPNLTNRDDDSQHVIFHNSGNDDKGLRFGYDYTNHKSVINTLDPGVAWGNTVLQDGGGMVGIGTGTAQPLARLDLGPDGGEKFYVYCNGASIRNGLGIDMSGTSRELSYFHSSTNAVDGQHSWGYRLDGDGSYVERMQLTGAGDLTLNSGCSLGVGVAANGTAGRIDAANDVVAYSTSDKRLKENIKPLDNALDKVLSISGVSFDWKELSKEEKETIHGNTGHDVGIIAQEIEAVLPEVVTTRDNGYKAVKYEKIVPLLIEAIKEQQVQIDELKECQCQK